MAEITINGEKVQIQPNAESHFRGLHLVVINICSGEVTFAKVFDTYRSSESLEYFICNNVVKTGDIVVAACQDDCSKNLSDSCRRWFEDMGSAEIAQLEFR